MGIVRGGGWWGKEAFQDDAWRDVAQVSSKYRWSISSDVANRASSSRARSARLGVTRLEKNTAGPR
jgi:hypothetical protein